MEDLHKEIEQLAGRKVEFKEVTLNGASGFIPIYLNHNIRISELQGTTEQEAAEKFIAFLKGQGDTHADTETGN
jgi:hypothetical protein